MDKAFYSTQTPMRKSLLLQKMIRNKIKPFFCQGILNIKEQITHSFPDIAEY